jgi:hypothetical protein
LILPNLIPSEGPIDFKASYDNHTNMLYLAFKDPATWCQTGSIELKCKNPQTAVRWLYRGLNAVFEGDGLSQLWSGGNAQGKADGKLVVPMSMALAAETLLTEDVYTIWFTGPYQPFEARHYSLEMILDKKPFPKAQEPLVAAFSNAFNSVSFPKNSQTEKTLIQCEYLLRLGTANSATAAHSQLAEIFILENLGTEQAIVAQLDTLRDTLISDLEKRTN